jgi:hypothetical protein
MSNDILVQMHAIFIVFFVVVINITIMFGIFTYRKKIMFGIWIYLSLINFIFQSSSCLMLYCSNFSCVAQQFWLNIGDLLKVCLVSCLWHKYNIQLVFD